MEEAVIDEGGRARRTRRPVGSTHVLFVVGTDRFAAADESLRALVDGLPSNVKVTIAGHHRPVLERITGDRPGIDRRVLPEVSSKRHLGRLGLLSRELDKIDATVAHLDKADVADLRSIEALLALRRTPVVSVVHRVERPATRVGEQTARLLARRARAVVAVGDGAARELESLLDLASGAVTVIPTVLPAFGDLRADEPPTEPFTVGVLSPLVGHRGVDLVIEAMTGFPEARLLVGGEGPLRADLEHLVERRGLTGQVEFLGRVDPARIFEPSHLLVSAAYIEGHPVPLLDAQRRGLPVVAVAAGAVADVVEDGVTGLLVPPHDVKALRSAIGRLRRDPTLRTAMGRAASSRRTGAQDRASMVSAYLDLYGHRPAVAGQPAA